MIESLVGGIIDFGPDHRKLVLLVMIFILCDHLYDVWDARLRIKNIHLGKWVFEFENVSTGLFKSDALKLEVFLKGIILIMSLNFSLSAICACES